MNGWVLPRGNLYISTFFFFFFQPLHCTRSKHARLKKKHNYYLRHPISVAQKLEWMTGWNDREKGHVHQIWLLAEKNWRREDELKQWSTNLSWIKHYFSSLWEKKNFTSSKWGIRNHSQRVSKQTQVWQHEQEYFVNLASIQHMQIQSRQFDRHWLIIENVFAFPRTKTTEG